MCYFFKCNVYIVMTRRKHFVYDGISKYAFLQEQDTLSCTAGWPSLWILESIECGSMVWLLNVIRVLAGDKPGIFMFYVPLKNRL